MSAPDPARWAIAAEQLQLQVLHPFQIGNGDEALAVPRLTELRWRERPVWSAGDPGYEGRDFLDNVWRLLFGRGEGTHGYLQVAGPAHNAWFQKRVLVRAGTGLYSATVPARPGIEVFVAPSGAGLLSVPLAIGQALVDPDSPRSPELSLPEVQQLVYLLAQRERHTAVPRLLLPHPGSADGRVKPLLGGRSVPPQVLEPPSPVAGAPSASAWAHWAEKSRWASSPSSCWAL